MSSGGISKKIIILPLLVAVLYFVSPYIQLGFFKEAIQNEDVVKLEKYVDWDSVRNGMKSDMMAFLGRQVSSEDNNLVRGMALLLGPAIINQIVENISASSLLMLIQKQSQDNNWQKADLIVFKAHFTGLNEFSVWLGNDGRSRMVMAFENFHWIVKRIVFRDDIKKYIADQNSKASDDTIAPVPTTEPENLLTSETPPSVTLPPIPTPIFIQPPAPTLQPSLNIMDEHADSVSSPQNILPQIQPQQKKLVQNTISPKKPLPFPKTLENVISLSDWQYVKTSLAFAYSMGEKNDLVQWANSGTGIYGTVFQSGTGTDPEGCRQFRVTNKSRPGAPFGYVDACPNGIFK